MDRPQRHNEETFHKAVTKYYLGAHLRTSIYHPGIVSQQASGSVQHAAHADEGTRVQARASCTSAR